MSESLISEDEEVFQPYKLSSTIWHKEDPEESYNLKYLKDPFIEDEAPPFISVSIKNRFFPRWKSVPIVTISVQFV